MAERIDVKANEIVFVGKELFSFGKAFGKNETPRKYKSILIDGKPVEIIKNNDGKYSFSGEGADMIHVLPTPDSVRSKDKVNFFGGKLESMTVIQGNYEKPTSFTYKAANEKTN